MIHHALFIAGTDTDAGKTLLSALLLRQYGGENPSLFYWKPVQTGSPPDDDVSTVERVSGFARGIRGKRFREPVSPHLAAELEGREIQIPELVSDLQQILQEHQLIIEGAGGLSVPLDRQTTWLDFLSASRLPVVLVARSTLGTINHSLLSIEALQRRSIPIAGIVFCGPENPDNTATILQFSGVQLIGRIDPLTDFDCDRDPVDANRLLAPWLGI